MDKTELEELAERLQDRFGSGSHYEIIFSEKQPYTGNWVLEVRKIEEKNGERGEVLQD